MTHGIFLLIQGSDLEELVAGGLLASFPVTWSLPVCLEPTKLGTSIFPFWPLGGARKLFFWLHHCNQRVTISNPTSFAIFPIIITFILKTDRLSVIVARQGNLLRRSATKVLENSLLSRIELLHTEKRTVFLHHSNEVLPYIICGA